MLFTRLCLFTIALLIMACAEKSPDSEFGVYHLKTFDEMITEHDPDFQNSVWTSKDEHFVIVSPPEDVEALKQLIVEYNRETLTEREVQKYSSYVRSFYRESEKLPRDYKSKTPGEPFPDNADNPRDERIATVVWNNHKELGTSVAYNFYRDGEYFATDNEHPGLDKRMASSRGRPKSPAEPSTSSMQQPDHDFEFFHLKELDKTEVYEHPQGSGKMITLKEEYFVVPGIPKQRSVLKKAISQYNQKTLTRDELKKREGYKRYFYRESGSLPRDYKEKYPKHHKEDTIEDHYEDLLLIVVWGNYGAEVTYDYYRDGLSVFSEIERDPG